MVRKFKETRNFGGRTYKYVTHYFRKENAKEAQARLQKKGHLTRITERKGVYHLWARKK